jgi:type IV pilus assembly protein PilC
MANVYKWSGTNERGVAESGEMVASSKEEVISRLRNRNILNPTIEEKKETKLLFGKKITLKDIVVFTRQLSTMIDAGLALVQSLEILSLQTENKNLAKIIEIIKIDIESGSTFADALKKHPRVFNELYVNLVAAGEAGGMLDNILNRLATHIEKIENIRKKVKGAMVYPAVVTTVAIIVVVIMMVFVVPTMAKMFTALGGTLPLPTKIVMAASDFIAGIGGLVLLGAMIAFVMLIIQMRRNERGKYVTDKILLATPVFGNILRKASIAHFTRTLGSLLSSGVQIIDSLDITARTSGNKVIEKAVIKSVDSILKGKPLSEPLTESKIFPPMVSQMISVGESSGSLELMLGKIADFYEEEVDAIVENLSSIIEPVLITFLGTVVGFIIIAMYLPIFKILTLIK